MRKGKVECSELLTMIPKDLLKNLEEETKVNHQVKKLSGSLTLKLLLFSLLNSERISLRVMEEIFNSDQFKIFAEKGNQKTKHSTIGDRIANINYEFFEKIYFFLADKIQSENVKSPKDIHIYDSTLVGLSSKLLHLGMCSSQYDTKRQVKFSIGLNNALPKGVLFFDNQSAISEEIALREAILSVKYDANSVILFDRGIRKRKTFCEFSDHDIFFVTRLNENTRFNVIKKFREIKGRKTQTLLLEKDVIVNLLGEKSIPVEKDFRLIIASSLKTKEKLLFLTNIFDLSAREITNLYKKRWEIEVFFKFLKQELNFKHFISRNENGIKVMMYATLILALLLLLYKKRNSIASYKIAKIRFAHELEMEIIKEIVLHCNGDILKFEKLKNSNYT